MDRILIKDHHNPWITNKVKILMRERDLWHNRANKSKNHFDISTNRKLRNKVTLIVPLMVEYMIKGRYFMPTNYKQKK